MSKKMDGRRKGTEQRMGERNHFTGIVDERAEQAAGLPGATPVFMIFKAGWHANHKTLIVTETYGQACGDAAIVQKAEELFALFHLST